MSLKHVIEISFVAVSSMISRFSSSHTQTERHGHSFAHSHTLYSRIMKRPMYIYFVRCKYWSYMDVLMYLKPKEWLKDMFRRRDPHFSLDSEFLATTSIDGSARIWKTNDGVPLTSLTRNSDEKIELCRFSKDGTKPFLFCTVQKGNRAVTVVWDISTWNRIGHKRLLRKPAYVMSVSLDGKYLALGSQDGDVCVVEVKKMEICHWSKRLHSGSCIASLEFCPNERVVLSTSKEWGAMVTKLNVRADWKEWQIYLLLLGLFLASVVAFYIFFENSDSFWNFPLGRDQPASPKSEAILGDPQSDGPKMWDAFGPLDM